MLDFSPIEPSVRAIVTTATGIITLDDIIEHLRRRAQEGVLNWPELFDARQVSIDLSLDDLGEIARRATEYAGGLGIGNLAVVSDNAFISTLAKAYGSIVGRERQEIRVFEYMDEAKEWILEQQTDTTGHEEAAGTL